MFSAIKSLFMHPSPETIRAESLAKAQRELLALEEAVEYNTAMRDMTLIRVARLNQQ